jgi:hypothetical protein
MAAVQPPQAFPLSFGEIEELVKTLSDPGHAKKITETEATLRVLQRSPQGWEIADALLSSTDENVRFFGALTFTVKLNADSADLSEEDSAQLLSKLIHHLVRHPSSSPATRKLCSTLAQYFCKPISVWTQCIRCLAVSFSTQQSVLDDALDSHPSSWDILPQLGDEQLVVLLEFARNLADDAKKLTGAPDRKIHERMAVNVECIEILLQVSLGRAIKYLSTPVDNSDYDHFLQLGEKVAVASLKCFTEWVFYGQNEFRDSPEKLRYLRSVIELTLTCLEYHVDDGMEVVADILENYPKFFEPNHQAMLWSAITSQWGIEIMKNLDAETVALARIIVAYGQTLLDSKKLYERPDDAHHQQVMSVFHGLLKYPEPVGVDDDVGPVVLEFWSNYITTISDESFEFQEADAKPEWYAKAASNVFLVISEFVQKITYPEAAVTKSWDEDAKKTFNIFRVDVRDSIQEAFNILHDALLDQSIDFSIRALEASNWLELEAGLFCLISIADLLPDDSADARLQRLFERPLFTIMSSGAEIPAVTRRGAVDTVAAFDKFFLRHPTFLPPVLSFLLSALAQSSLAHGAAKSFASLCSECRKSLTGELPSFFEMYQQFISYPTANETTKSKVLEGIAAIVQAQDSDEKQLAGLQQLFTFIYTDAMHAVTVIKEGGDPEEGLVLARTTVKCLHSIGKAMQASDDEIFDLTTGANVSSKPTSTFWTQGPGKEIQNQIINFINYLTGLFPGDGDIIESSCNILRVGFKEPVPGAFVLPPGAAISYIAKTTLETPRLPLVLETACCWISSNKPHPGLSAAEAAEIEAQSQRLLQYVVGLLASLQHPRTDPEIAVGCIELIQKFMLTNPLIFSSQTPDILSATFNFTIEALKSPEVLPKRAAAHLWKDIFELCDATRQDKAQATCADIVGFFGKEVVAAVVWNLCGEVDQSSLEHISAPLRKCVSARTESKMWITEQLNGNLLIARAKEMVGEEVEGWVRKFVEGLVRNARSSSAFKDTVKEFWERCKQLQMRFAPPPAHMVHASHRFAHTLTHNLA